MKRRKNSGLVDSLFLFFFLSAAAEARRRLGLTWATSKSWVKPWATFTLLQLQCHAKRCWNKVVCFLKWWKMEVAHFVEKLKLRNFRNDSIVICVYFDKRMLIFHLWWPPVFKDENWISSCQNGQKLQFHYF